MNAFCIFTSAFSVTNSPCDLFRTCSAALLPSVFACPQIPPVTVTLSPFAAAVSTALPPTDAERVNLTGIRLFTSASSSARDLS